MGTGVVTTDMPDCGGIDTPVTVGMGTGGTIDTSVTLGIGTGGTLIMLPVPTIVKHISRQAEEGVLTCRAWRLNAVHVARPWVDIISSGLGLNSIEGFRLRRGTDEWRGRD